MNATRPALQQAAIDIVSTSQLTAGATPGTTSPMPVTATTTRNPSPIRRLIGPRKTERSASPEKDERSTVILPPYSQLPQSQPAQANSAASISPRRGTISEQNPEPTTEFDYLTALASQERKVLELKEQLQKAEEDLQQLKRKWANHEATNRRNEGRRMHQMRPLSISSAKTITGNEDTDGSSAWMYEEMERRKALLGNAKTSHRRVFSGSRETKTLSLLVPEKFEKEKDVSSPIVETDDDGRQPRDPIKRLAQPVRSMTTPDLSLGAASQYHIDRDTLGRRDSRSPHRSPQRDAIVRTGKQVAADLKDGFWTFFEDLRQAAVGDEARSGQDDGSEQTKARAQPNPRKTSPAHRKGTRDPSADENITDAGGSFWRDQGLPEPTPVVSPRKLKPAKTKTPQRPPPSQPRTADGSPWDTWDSPRNTATTKPSPARSNSSTSVSHKDGASSSRSPSSLPASSPSTSVTGSATTPSRRVSDVGREQGQRQVRQQRDAIPWPALGKFAPGMLVRSASNLMDEWERSLTPSPSPSPSPSGERERGAGRGDGNGVAGVHDGCLL